jgi:hypothetical protein
MREIFLLVCRVLLAVAVVLLCYALIIWVLGMLGISVPADILRYSMVVLILLAIIAVVSGSYSNWWPPKS